MERNDSDSRRGARLGLGLPATWAAAGLFCGVLAGSALPAERTTVAVGAILGTAACAAGALVRRAARPALLSAAFLLGSIRIVAARAEDEAVGAHRCLVRDVDVHRGRDAVVAAVGTVEGLPVADRSGWPGPDECRTTFFIALEGFEARDRLALARGRLRVSAAGRLPDDVAGSRLRIVGRLRSGGRLVTRGENVTRLDSPTISRGTIERLRARAIQRLEEHLSGEPLGVAAALVLGIYGYMSADLVEAHGDTGSLPFLAISGLHVAIVATGFRWLLGRAAPRRRRAMVLTVVLGAYSLFVGNASPVARSAMGLCFLAMGNALGRPAGGLAPLATAMCFELVLRPGEGLKAGFQLSYGAVFGFLLFAREADGALARIPIPNFPPRALAAIRGLRIALALAAVAFLSTAGITALHFGQVVPASLVLSLPLTLLMPPMMFFSWGALLPGDLGAACATAFAGLEGVERWLVLATDGLPATPLHVNPALAPAITLACLAPLLWLRRARRLAAASGVLALVALSWLPRPPEGSLEIWIHDVGHGLAATAIFPDGTAAQIDAGSRDLRTAGRRVVAPALWRLGIASFTAVSLSHDDADHANAFADLFHRFPTDRVVARRDTIWEPLFRAARPKERSTGVDLAPGGARARWFGVDPGPLSKPNDRETVAILEFAGRRVLFPGDLEQAGVEALVTGPIPIRCDILVLPHHGLDNGQIDRILSAASPSIAIASNGERYSTESAERKLAERGIPWLSTRDHGNLRIRVRPDGAVAVTARN